jgi:hypothetical protein
MQYWIFIPAFFLTNFPRSSMRAYRLDEWAWQKSTHFLSLRGGTVSSSTGTLACAGFAIAVKLAALVLACKTAQAGVPVLLKPIQNIGAERGSACRFHAASIV